MLTCSFGQKQFAIKIYQNTDIFKTKYYETRNREWTKFDHVNFTRITLALEMTTEKGYRHEIELLVPEISKSPANIQFPLNYEFRKDITFEGKASAYSFRYALSKIRISKPKRFAFDFGMGLNPYYIHIEYMPHVATTYYWSTKLYGLALNVIPQMRYKLSSRFDIDVNLLLKMVDLRGESSRIENPAIPVRQQKVSHYNSIFFEGVYTLRFGLMYKFE